MDNQPKIFVIVVTYKGKQWYDKCFSSLRESTLPVQTIVVDNTPGEEDANYIREHYPETLILKPEQNLGFGKGNNIAMKYAREHDADYVFLLNQDTWMIDNEMFAELVRISESHPEYGIISPMHVQADGRTIGMLLEDGNNKCSIAMLSDLYKGELKDIYETNYVNAAGWLLPRNTLETVGGFDPIYQHYEEDDDYLNRVTYHGLKVGVCPHTKMVHNHHESELPFSDERWLYHHQQQIIVKLTNPNTKNPIRKEIRYYLRKSFNSITLGDFKGFTNWYRDLSFVIRMRSSILNSRNQNRQIKSSWL